MHQPSHHPLLAPANFLTATAAASSRDAQFLFMLRGYRATGGFLRERDLGWLARLEHASESHVAALDIEWQGEIWLPAFQFVGRTRSIRAEVSSVLAELAPSHDHWELGLWFVEPNLWLADTPPVDLLALDPTAVLGAARADRFIARG